MSSTAQAPSRPSAGKRLNLYKGDPGMWSWVAHRISGVALFFYLFVHVMECQLDYDDGAACHKSEPE